MIIPLKLFFLGLGSVACILFLQVFLLPFFPEKGLLTIIFLTIIEETIRFLILYFSERKDILPSSGALIPIIFFGTAFALGEILISQSSTPLHMTLLFIIHIALSLLTFFGIRPRNMFYTLSTYGLVLIIHLSYNTLIWFA